MDEELVKHLAYANKLSEVYSLHLGKEVNMIDAIELLHKSWKTWEEWEQVCDEGKSFWFV